MLPTGKYQIARPGQPSRQMSLSEINFGLASGEVMPDDQFWIKGMPRWERVRELAGVILPTSPKTRPPVANAANGSRSSAAVAEPVVFQNHGSSGAENLSFWAQPETKPRVAVWSPVMYTVLSAFFTPLIGSLLIAQNHRATGETIWRGVSWFWLVVWSGFLLTGLSLHFCSVPCGPILYWIVGFMAFSAAWFFTCALPHRSFLQTRPFDAAWRTDWGKPVGFGFLAWVIVFTVFLLTR